MVQVNPMSQFGFLPGQEGGREKAQLEEPSAQLSGLGGWRERARSQGVKVGARSLDEQSLPPPPPG